MLLLVLAVLFVRRFERLRRRVRHLVPVPVPSRARSVPVPRRRHPVPVQVQEPVLGRHSRQDRLCHALLHRRLWNGVPCGCRRRRVQ